MNILENLNDNYKRWADEKLEGFTSKIDNLLVEIRDPLNISITERKQIKQIINSNNMVFFRSW